jgi:hypothetical protein
MVSMADNLYQIIRVCPEHMCRIFAAQRLMERALRNEFDVSIESNPIEPPWTDWNNQLCVATEAVFIEDRSFPVGHHRREVARAHQYRTDQGTLGGSGKADPKDLMLGDVNFRIIKRRLPRCVLCEDCGDMIPPEQRFHNSHYKPGSF